MTTYTSDIADPTLHNIKEKEGWCMVQAELYTRESGNDSTSDLLANLSISAAVRDFPESLTQLSDLETGNGVFPTQEHHPSKQGNYVLNKSTGGTTWVPKLDLSRCYTSDHQSHELVQMCVEAHRKRGARSKTTDYTKIMFPSPQPLDPRERQKERYQQKAELARESKRKQQILRGTNSSSNKSPEHQQRKLQEFYGEYNIARHYQKWVPLPHISSKRMPWHSHPRTHIIPVHDVIAKVLMKNPRKVHDLPISFTAAAVEALTSERRPDLENWLYAFYTSHGAKLDSIRQVKDILWVHHRDGWYRHFDSSNQTQLALLRAGIEPNPGPPTTEFKVFNISLHSFGEMIDKALSLSTEEREKTLLSLQQFQPEYYDMFIHQKLRNKLPASLRAIAFHLDQVMDLDIIDLDETPLCPPATHTAGLLTDNELEASLPSWEKAFAVAHSVDAHEKVHVAQAEAEPEQPPRTMPDQEMAKVDIKEKRIVLLTPINHPIFSTVNVTKKGVTYYQDQYSQEIHVLAVDQAKVPTIAIRRPEHGELPYIEKESGFLKKSSLHYHPQSVFLYTIPPLEIVDIHIPARQVIVSQNAINILRDRWPQPHLSQQNYKAMLGTLAKLMPSLLPELRIQSVDFFISQAYVAQCVLSSECNKRIAQLCKLEGLPTYQDPSGLVEMDLTHALGLPYDLGAYFRIPAGVDEVPKNNTDNLLFFVERETTGYTFDTPCHTDQPSCLAGHFDTRDSSVHRWYSSQYTALMGSKHFNLLDNQPSVMEKALYRLHQARPDEETLRYNQTLLSDPTDSFWREFFNAPEIEPSSFTRTTHQQLVYQILNTFYKETTFSAKWKFKAQVWWKKAKAFSFKLPCYLICSTFARLRYVSRDHPKKALYQKWFNEIEMERGHDYQDPINDRIEVKIKKELAKPGKHARLFTSYGKSILQAGWAFDGLKNCMSGVHNMSSVFGFPVYIEVVKSLDTTTIIDPYQFVGGVYFRLFSDDITMTYWTPHGTVAYADLDISACDAGNGYPMFHLLARYASDFGLGKIIEVNLRRLKQKLTIRNPVDGTQKLVVRPKHIFQGSGCPETTLVNNFASLSICLSLASHMGGAISPVMMPDLAKAAAAEVGHVVTFEERKCIEETQFLKHSPLQNSHDRYVQCLNYGAIFRGFGAVMGDLQPKQINCTPAEYRKLSPADRMEKYLSAVVASYCNEPGSIVMDALRDRFGSTKGISMRFFTLGSRSNHYIPIASLMARYGGEDYEWEQLANEIRSLDLGVVRTHPLMDRIMARDYGL